MPKESEKQNHSSDFEALHYLESERSEQEFFVDLETLLREYLQKPSLYHTYLNAEGKLTDRNGLSLVEMCERANERCKGTLRFERVKAETDGLRVLEALYRDADESDVVLLAMPPGTKEEGFGDMSMTNISLVKQDGKNKKVETFTVPSFHLSTEAHLEMLSNVSAGKEVETYHINSNPRPDIVLSSHPIKIPDGVLDGVLDKVSQALGYRDFVELQKVVDVALKLEEDPKAEGRRTGLMSYIAKQIVSFREKQNRNGLIALGRTVRTVFALEAVGGFQNVEMMEMIGKFKEYMHGFMFKQEVDETSNPGTSMAVYSNDPRMEFLWELQRRLQMNPDAQDRLEASMCGGGGWQDMFNTKYGGEMSNLQNPSAMQDILAKSESKAEKYEFDKDGTCKVCGESSDKVGKLGPCLICKGCDHKIRSQVE